MLLASPCLSYLSSYASEGLGASVSVHVNVCHLCSFACSVNEVFEQANKALTFAVYQLQNLQEFTIKVLYIP